MTVIVAVTVAVVVTVAMVMTMIIIVHVGVTMTMVFARCVRGIMSILCGLLVGVELRNLVDWSLELRKKVLSFRPVSLTCLNGRLEGTELVRS